MSYTVSDVKIRPADNVSPMIYTENDEYYTVDSSTNEATWESERNILEHHSNIPTEQFDSWLKAVMDFINDYNDGLGEPSVRFEITAVRSNAMYNYKKYVNDVMTQEGWMDYSMVPEAEMDPWVTGVVNFRKENNMPLPKEEASASLNQVNSVRNLGTSPYDDDTSGSTPNIVSAISCATTNPCQFPSKLTEAVKTGLSGPMDKLNNVVMGLKKEVNLNLSMSVDDFNTAVGPVMDPVINAVETQVNNRSDEDDVADECWRKQFARELELMNRRLETPESDNTSSNGGGNSEGGGEEGGDDSPIITTSSGYEIPAWMTTNIDNAMKSRFAKGEPARDTLDRFNANKSYFFKVFQKYNVPTQLTVLSIIESNVKNISTENHATAKGMWQIVRLSGQQYGLLKLALKPGLGEDYNKYESKNYNIVSSYDKRNQLEPSTEAAAKMLRDIRKGRTQIYNWLLVAAAYNWGGGNVTKAITKAGRNATVWDVWKRLPLETRNYVCLVIGLCNYLGFSIDPLFS